MSTPKTIRCAIYTRKSSDEGLDQEFNTLAAQREACEAYVKSQAHEGWRALPEHFDDGGHSGGTLGRPAMLRLLERVKERRIDVILIYKIDRLTRSLTDFARLAELFDKHGVSFVSVTQQFNTTTSMGRLMLNVLLSFAQFEREIAGERIRDKIAASKKKGMWMGGSVPLGYDWKNKKLIINEAETKTVRTLFDLYLKLGNVRLVVAEAARLGLRTKVRPTAKGQRVGGHEFRRGHVYAILRNPIYLGRIPHREQSYAAEHKPLITEKVWHATQLQLDQNRQGKHPASNNTDQASPLAGILFDEQGNRFTASHTVKGRRRYRYYVEQALVTGETPAKGELRRITATEIEGAVRDGIVDFLTSPTKLIKAIGSGIGTEESEKIIRQAKEVGNKLQIVSSSSALTHHSLVLQRVIVSPTDLKIRISINALRKFCGASGPHAVRPNNYHELQMPIRVGRRGVQRKLVLTENSSRTAIDPALIKALAQAHHWWEEIINGPTLSLNEITRQEGKASSYIGRVLRLRFLAPHLQERILNGQQPPDVTVKRLILYEPLELRWPSEGALH
ncbi:MAG: recombinase family protein [Alphaproteobacteria bacterium]